VKALGPTRCAILLALAACLAPRSAAAHAIGLSTGEYRRTADGLAVELFFATSELAFLPERDVVAKIHVVAGEAECAGEFVDALPTERDGVRLRARYRCPDAQARLVVRLEIFDDLSHGHRHEAHVRSGAFALDELCFRQHAEFEVPPSSSDAPSDATRTASALGFARMGLEHILSGYDHLLFLFALVIVGGSVWSLLRVVSAFTAAHSITLALAVIGIVSPAPRIVEPAIALSIAYVGMENLWRRDLDKRWRITFLFGLVHGFGFAGALTDVNLPRAEVPWALVSFNVGVELGQLLLLALVWPVVGRLRRWQKFDRRLVPAFSFCIAMVGAAWFVERATFRPAIRPVAEESSITAGS
jgi:hydrogenase/urease accessory protein HupE